MTQEADVFPSFYLWILSHGTRCAGEVAALANNTICGTGVAYHAHVGGRIILEKITSICFCYCKISDVFLCEQPTIRYSDILACHQGILFIHFFSLEIYFGAMLVVVTSVLSDFDGCQYWAEINNFFINEKAHHGFISVAVWAFFFPLCFCVSLWSSEKSRI